tara:strand:+ start:1958 stop:3001 length:1044 start_codon:yes stop_codon:yes gene_type:complete
VENKMGLFHKRDQANSTTGVPVWFMRQAGRYHDHYQSIKAGSDFMTMCKNPQLAHDVTMGPINEFDFDAAILFSDLLFPLEYLGMGLVYNPGPILGMKISDMSAIFELKPQGNPEDFYKFQKEATKLLKASLPQNKSLLGFVGAPWTLYAYAVEGGHAGNLIDAKKGLYDGRWTQFLERLMPGLLTEMILQAEGGADAVCIFDTAAGELDRFHYDKYILPALRKQCMDFKRLHPETKIIYYSKHTHMDYLKAIECEAIDVLGIDWRMDLPTALRELGSQYMIQGNFDPSLLHLEWNHVEAGLERLWKSVQGQDLSRWIMGLGHGVLPLTPQENVKKAVEYIHKNFRY